MKLRKSYTFNPDRFGNPAHSWSIVGAKGAIELNIVVMDKYGVTGGIEVHSRTATSDCPPDHDECHLLHQPCWHDGSSLWVEENIKPNWSFPSSPEYHDRMFSELERWYADRFGTEEEGGAE